MGVKRPSPSGSAAKPNKKTRSLRTCREMDEEMLRRSICCMSSSTTTSANTSSASSPASVHASAGMYPGPPADFLHGVYATVLPRPPRTSTTVSAPHSPTPPAPDQYAPPAHAMAAARKPSFGSLRSFQDEEKRTSVVYSCSPPTFFSFESFMTSSKQPPACGRASATGSAKDLGFPEAVDLAESRLTPLDGHFDDELLWEMNFEDRGSMGSSGSGSMSSSSLGAIE
mmetsp:Transcript_10839/g.21577  ORF Transcript_10839/g.21577 Transcript_10839/m.21577 type:complete len:227 (-) Transcript_10839:207-887(-)